MRVLALSDLHDNFAAAAPETLPDADLCLIAGDLTNYGKRSRHKELFFAEEWLKGLGKRYPTFWIPGNHDIRVDCASFSPLKNVTCILDQTVYWNGLSLHGVSMSPCYDRPRLAKDWDYMTADREKERLAYAFEGVDIVISHSPPFGCCDLAQSRSMPEPLSIGSEELRAYVETHAPKLVICGHVHEAQGTGFIGETLVINAAQAIVTLEL